jgi:hypothetical protein
MLSEYVATVQGFIRDRGQRYMNPEDIRGYVNRARREVAERTQSIRILTPISGAIVGAQVTSPGSGYTNPAAVISTPDTPSGQLPYPAGAQATATVQMIGGQISNVGMSFGGAGYFQPSITISDPTGSGAVVVPQIQPITITRFQQEVYPFWQVPLQTFPGVDSVFAVKSISFIYANYRYSIPIYPFSVYQAMIRQYPRQYLYIPTLGAQYGQGTNGSIYVYPIPSASYQYEWDCFCLPSDLIDDTTYEAIPLPWTDAVPYFAAHLCFLELQNLNSSRFYLDLYDTMVHRYSAYARPGRMINPYGRY